jgi:hypothetical protein
MKVLVKVKVRVKVLVPLQQRLLMEVSSCVARAVLVET